jgi:hypothetical protein
LVKTRSGHRLKIANGIEAVQDGRIYIERINAPFLAAGGSGEDFRAGIERAIAQGWLWRLCSASMASPRGYPRFVILRQIIARRSQGHVVPCQPLQRLIETPSSTIAHTKNDLETP